MGLRYACGRGTQVRHSTAMEWDELEKKKKKRGYQPIKYSTGENAAVKHATGTEFDWKAMRGRPEENEVIHPKVRSKPRLEGDEYVESYLESRREEWQNKMKSREHKQETKKTGEKGSSNKRLKKIKVEY